MQVHRRKVKGFQWVPFVMSDDEFNYMTWGFWVFVWKQHFSDEPRRKF